MNTSLESKRNMKRFAKSKLQTAELMKLYHDTRGETKRESILKVSASLDLQEKQVYKWMWDQKQRQDRNTAEIMQCNYPMKRNVYLEHRDCYGNFLTPVEV
jgi:hypothetical protein